MRTEKATRWHSKSQHNQFGIYNWFATVKRIKDEEVIREVVKAFCEENGFKSEGKKNEEASMMNYAGNRFVQFANFATKYINDNFEIVEK